MTYLRTLNLTIIQCGLPLLDLGTDYFNSIQSVSSTMSSVSSAIGFAMLPSVWNLTNSKPGFLSQYQIFRKLTRKAAVVNPLAWPGTSHQLMIKVMITIFLNFTPSPCSAAGNFQFRVALSYFNPSAPGKTKFGTFSCLKMCCQGLAQRKIYPNISNVCQTKFI